MMTKQRLNRPFSIVKAKGGHMCDGLTGLTGCVQVTAPDKPIVINLNIAIRQEVLIRLDAASKKVTEENPEIF
jgi:hypothetical protein